MLKDTKKFNKKHGKEYDTEFHKMIQQCLDDSGYRKAYEWQNEKIFVSDNILIEVMDYNINTFDWCIVKMDGEEIRITKRELSELYRNKNA
ncbi:MAG: hypothetical protein WCY33_05695 [Clostridia bacterium]|jgi:hypothetical protein